MKLTKLGHCCLLIEEAGLTLLTDPGDYTTAQGDVRGVNIVLITHEHLDHLHIESLKTVLVNNPAARIFTNRGVGEILQRGGIRFSLLEHGQSAEVNGVRIEAHGDRHAPIYPSVPEVVNTGYLIGGKLFYPGDALHNPGKAVEVLALPVAGPWLKIADSLDYAKAVHPNVCFPVHDGALKIYGAAHKLPAKELPEHGIKFVIPEPGKLVEF